MSSNQSETPTKQVLSPIKFPEKVPSNKKENYEFMKMCFSSFQAQIKEINDRMPAIEEIKQVFHNQVAAQLKETNVKIESFAESNKAILGRIEAMELSNNHQEQRSRNQSIRITNFKLGDNTNAVDCSVQLYTRLIRPAMEEALKNKSLKSIPEIFEVIEYSHPLRTNGNKIPVVIARLTSRLFKLIFHRNKNAILNKLSTESGLTIKVYDDLTQPNLACIHRLYEDEAVEKAWSVSGQLKYTLKSNTRVVLTVTNPFADSIFNMTKQPRSSLTGPEPRFGSDRVENSSAYHLGNIVNLALRATDARVQNIDLDIRADYTPDPATIPGSTVCSTGSDTGSATTLSSEPASDPQITDPLISSEESETSKTGSVQKPVSTESLEKSGTQAESESDSDESDQE